MRRLRMDKNQIVEVTIEDLSREGEGIGHVEGYTLFVKDAVIGDRIRARITRPKKSFAYARTEEILRPSPDRVTPRCPEARRCGGCTLQAMSYEAQLAFKRQLVADALHRIGGFDVSISDSDDAGDGSRTLYVRPVLGMEEPFRYRNKAQYPIAWKTADGAAPYPAAGFYAARTHSLIEVRDCVLTPESFSERSLRLAESSSEEKSSNRNVQGLPEDFSRWIPWESFMAQTASLSCPRERISLAGMPSALILRSARCAPLMV